MINGLMFIMWVAAIFIGAFLGAMCGYFLPDMILWVFVKIFNLLGGGR